MIPNDGRQTKYRRGDGGYTHVRVTVRGTPITAKPTPGRVVNQLKRPTKLGNDVRIGQCRHIRVGPSVHGNIILVCLEGHIEFIRIRDDVDSDVKVSCPDVILVKEFVEAIGWLYKHVKTGIRTPLKSQKERMTHRKRSVIEPDTNDTRGRVIYDTRDLTAV